MDETHARVSEILLKRRDPLERIAQELMRKETLERAELDRLIGAPEPNVESKEPVSAGPPVGRA